MSIFYHLIDKSDQEYLGSFITSLFPKRIHTLEHKADDIYHTDSLDSKSEILFELIKKEDGKFKVFHVKEIEI